MKLDDPELLKKEPVALVPYSKNWKSLYCRNNYHNRCVMATCQCDCHVEAAKQLAHQLGEQGALRKCYGMGCVNLVDRPDDLFCKDCNSGRTPGVRAREAQEMIDNHIERHLTRPL